MTLSSLPAFSTRNIHRPPPLAHIALRRHSVLANPADEEFLHAYHPCARASEELNSPTTPTTPIPQNFRSECSENGTGSSELGFLSSPGTPGELQQLCPATPLASTFPNLSCAAADSSPSSSSSTSFSSSSSPSSISSSSPQSSLASLDIPESSSVNSGDDEVPITPTTPLPGSRISSAAGSSSSNFSSAGVGSNSTLRNSSAEASITQIFQFQRWKPTKQESIPKLNETQPLSLYFHADEQLTAAVKALAKVRDAQSEKYRRYTDRVHRAQNLLLDTVYLIYNELDDHMKSPREYRHHLPSEDQAELDDGFSENILFAAEALSRGFRIRGIENFTDQLLEPAKQLCASFEALRFVFRCRALEQNRCGSTNGGSSGQRFRSLAPGAPSSSSPPLQNPYVPLYPVLVDFDKAWTGFEQKICFAYFAVTYNRHYGTPLPTTIPDTFPSTFPPPDYDTEMFAVLVSESLIRATKRKLITWTQIQECHPAVMFAIPRLSIVAGLVHMPECVNMTDPEKSFWWFREKVKVLQQLQKSLQGLSTEELDMLERALVGEIEDDEGENETEPSEKGEPASKSEDSEAANPPEPLLASHASGDNNFPALHSNQSNLKSIISSTLSKPHLRFLFTTVCSIADSLQSGPRARDFSSVLEKVFNCHS